MKNVDRTDEKIIALLRTDARMPNIEIAKKVGLSEGAVRNRIKRMAKQGIIKHFTIETSYGEIMAIVMIKTEPESTKKVADKISEIGKVYELSGSFDIAAFLSGADIDELNRKIDLMRMTPGVNSTETHIILRTV